MHSLNEILRLMPRIAILTGTGDHTVLLLLLLSLLRWRWRWTLPIGDKGVVMILMRNAIVVDHLLLIVFHVVFCRHVAVFAAAVDGGAGVGASVVVAVQARLHLGIVHPIRFQLGVGSLLVVLVVVGGGDHGVVAERVVGKAVHVVGLKSIVDHVFLWGCGGRHLLL